MYRLQEKKHQNNKKQVGVEIFRRLEDTEIPDEIETKVIFVSVIVPDDFNDPLPDEILDLFNNPQ